MPSDTDPKDILGILQIGTTLLEQSVHLTMLKEALKSVSLCLSLNKGVYLVEGPKFLVNHASWT
jgi:hypothetical protein